MWSEFQHREAAWLTQPERESTDHESHPSMSKNKKYDSQARGFLIEADYIL